MGFFGEKKSAEEKANEKMAAFMERYQLEDLDEQDLIVLERIVGDLAGNKFLKAGLALSFAKAEDQAVIGYLSALVEQNWLIIRQLSRLNRNLESAIEE